MNRTTDMSAWGMSLLSHGLVLGLLLWHPGFSSKPPVIALGTDARQIIQATIQTEIPRKKNPLPAVPQQRSLPVPRPSPFQKQQLLSDLKKKFAKQNTAHSEVRSSRILNARTLQKELLAEKLRIENGLRAERTRGEVDRYRSLILQVISQNWRVPGIPDKKLSAALLIQLAPDGTVLDVQIVKGSGNPGLDGSARAAVFHASPLPIPKNPDAFEAFRSFVLRVKPENISTSTG